MKLEILYDNTISEKGYLSGWGFSCLVDEHLLFDTGEFSEILFHNMEERGVEISQIDQIVISHDHYDHQGGLRDLLKLTDGVKVYLGKRYTSELEDYIIRSGNELIHPEDWTEVSRGMYLTPELEFNYKGTDLSERGLVIRGSEGLVLLTGCSHPGIERIAEMVQSHFLGEQIFLVAGGFHLKSAEEEEIERVVKQLMKMGIKKAAPTHCSGEIAQDIFKYYYQENYISLGAGRVIEIQEIS